MEEQGISLERLSGKDKFHLLRVPKGFDIKQLNGVTYNPGEIIEVEAKKDKNGLVTVYEMGTHSSQSMDLNVLVKSDDRIKVGPALIQNLSITKTVRLDSQETHFAVAGLQSALSGNVSLPVGLRERFTPFGSNCPISPTKKNNSKKVKKGERQSDVSPSPSEKRQRLLKTHNNNKIVSSSRDYSVGAFGDAGSVFTGTPTIDKKKKHKKKRKSSESEFQVNGDISSETNDTFLENGLDSSVVDDRGDSGEAKLHKKKKKHSSQDESMQITGDDSINQALDESMVKRHKKKKKKDKDY